MRGSSSVDYGEHWRDMADVADIALCRCFVFKQCGFARTFASKACTRFVATNTATNSK